MSEQSNLQLCHTTLQKAASAIGAVLEGSSDELDLLTLNSQLQAVSDALVNTLSPLESAQDELLVLKTDLTARMQAMTRAMAVARDRCPDEEMALLCADIDNASARELVRLYRRTCARFRDTFPGAAPYLSATAAKCNDWSEYKSA